MLCSADKLTVFCHQLMTVDFLLCYGETLVQPINRLLLFSLHICLDRLNKMGCSFLCCQSVCECVNVHFSHFDSVKQLHSTMTLLTGLLALTVDGTVSQPVWLSVSQTVDTDMLASILPLESLTMPATFTFTNCLQTVICTLYRHTAYIEVWGYWPQAVKVFGTLMAWQCWLNLLL